MDEHPRVLLLGGFQAHSHSLAGELERAGMSTTIADTPPDATGDFDVALVSAAHPACVRMVRALRAEAGPVVLVIGMPGHHAAVLGCLEGGAGGLVAANEPFESLVRAVREAAGRDRAGGCRLTRRQTQVLALMAAGLPNREIADRLGVRTHTVKNHVQSILGKLGVSNRTAATVALTGGGAADQGGAGLGVG